jgi:uncharacterized membrane protein (DUF373 family)/truncated hemoglobin YjbI
METIGEILKHYHFKYDDQKNLTQLAEILLPASDDLAEEFYDYLAEDPLMASFFPDETAVRRRKATLKAWLRDLLTAQYDHRYLSRLQRIGKTHVEIGLKGHYVNAAMHFVREACRRRVSARAGDEHAREALLATLDKALDISLDVMTSSYREAELNRVFLSERFESVLVQWAERLLHGLNLILMIGLLAMALGVMGLFAYDVFGAFSSGLAQLDKAVIKALGSLLILWMMIELLHAEVGYIRGGHFPVRGFLELALVAFIRKLFVAALEHADPLNFGLLLGALLVLGVIFYLVTRTEQDRSR